MPKIHIVASGDTLSKLAVDFYNNADRASLIASASGIPDPDVIREGQVLVIPDITRTHTVGRDDTLSILADRFYNNAGLFRVIAAANGIPNPDVIRDGHLLVIPDVTQTRTVVANDTLTKLSERFYGDASRVMILATVNGIKDPDVILTGQVLSIPDLTSVPKPHRPLSGNSNNTVVAGVKGTNMTPERDEAGVVHFGGIGVLGECDNQQSFGVRGNSARGFGVWGSGGNTGVVGESSTGDGIFGRGKFTGVTGFHGDPRLQETTIGSIATKAGVFGASEDGFGVLGYARTGLAGQFFGDVAVSGDISLTGGADCAEDFDVADDAEAEPGTVMALDDLGYLRECRAPYDKKVAGVVSGAGDYRPGMILDRTTTDGKRMPVALLGKVFCKVDARYGQIHVGDLLTTSPNPGHAMRAEDREKSFGATIGKAMRPLLSGVGLIPVLIALQ